MLGVDVVLAAKLRFFMTVSNDGVFVLDKQGRILAVNDEACHLLAHDRKDVIGTLFRAWRTTTAIHPLPYETRPDSLMYEGVFYRREKTFIADVSISTIEHEPVLYLAQLRDATTRQETHYKGALATAVFDNSLHGIMITDATNTILAVNAAFESITGYSAAEVIGANPRILQSGRHSQEFYAQMWQSLHTTGRWQGDIFDKRKDGSIYPKWLTLSVIRDSAGAISHYIALFTDRTEHIVHERRLQQLTGLYGALSQLNKLITRHPDQNTLFAGVCRIAVELGQMRIAWIGLLDQDHSFLTIVASYGKDHQQLRDHAIPIQDPHSARMTVAGEAVYRGHRVIDNTYANNARPQLWHDLTHTLDVESVAAFPIRRSARIIGVLSVYATDPNFFDDELTHLFQRMTDDISYALDSADKEMRRLAAESRAHYLARHDTLTGLRRRNVLEEALAIEHTKSIGRLQPYTIALIDLDRFKVINDSYGHAAGDEVLIHVAKILKDGFRTGDLIGRWGGEEFLCLLPGIDSTKALPIMEQLCQNIAQSHVHYGGRLLSVSASIGIASYPAHGAKVDDLLAQVDAALYTAKQQGGNQIAAAGNTPGIFWIGGQIEEALRTHQIRAAYQPMIALTTGEVVAEEALARLVLPDQSILVAGDFMDAAIHFGQIQKIDQAIIQQVIAHCLTHSETHTPKLQFFNTAAGLLTHNTYLAELLDDVVQHGKPQSSDLTANLPFVIEINERTLIRDRQLVRRNISPLLEAGFRVALDDFGSGYASLLYLADLPISFLKIDPRLTNEVGGHPRIAALIKNIATIGQELGLTTIAKGIYDQTTADKLRDLGINWGQGYLFGKPTLSV